MYGAVATAFQELLRAASRKFQTQREFAKALGISVARLNRALNTADYTLNVQNCLRLAILVNESPSTILRAADKSEIADLIERLYGRSDLTPAQRQLVEKWGRLGPDDQAYVDGLLDHLAALRGKFLAQRDAARDDVPARAMPATAAAGRRRRRSA
jgi:transcriptional regulator with XRE-family HTH domain